MPLSNRLEYILRMRGMSQSELARALGVNRVSVHQWVHGKTVPRLPMLQRIADVLNCQVSELIEEEQAADLINEFIRSLTDEQRKKILEHLKAM